MTKTPTHLTDAAQDLRAEFRGGNLKSALVPRGVPYCDYVVLGTAAMTFDDPAHGWQPIDEVKPMPRQRVLTYWGGNDRLKPVIQMNQYNPEPRELGSSDWWASKPDQMPSHWKPLPATPTGDT